MREPPNEHLRNAITVLQMETDWSTREPFVAIDNRILRAMHDAPWIRTYREMTIARKLLADAQSRRHMDNATKAAVHRVLWNVIQRLEMAENPARGTRYVTCPECEANFPVSALVNGALPPHKFLGTRCPGSGVSVRLENPVRWPVRAPYSVWLNNAQMLGSASTLVEAEEIALRVRPQTHPRPGGDVVTIRYKNKIVKALTLRNVNAPRTINPPLVVLGNPPRPRGRKLGRLTYVEYTHEHDGRRYYHDFKQGGAVMTLAPDGRSVHVTSPSGKKLWKLFEINERGERVR